MDLIREKQMEGCRAYALNLLDQVKAGELEMRDAMFQLLGYAYEAGVQQERTAYLFEFESDPDRVQVADLETAEAG